MRAGEAKIELKERFVELRAAGHSYEACAQELGVSKPTLISWARELVLELQNARALRLDELFERFAVSKARRVEAFGRRLEGILAELDKRDLAEVKTEVLLSLALKYGESLRDEYQPLAFQGEEDPGALLDLTLRQTWQG
ncbi:MAG: hypothetical protein HYW07_10310 [Candidatus Latescibacteria bacterium]|nr:hypothetical protein [Candidatus Latescibacterota bacterium]